MKVAPSVGQILNYIRSVHYHRHGQTQMALKTAEFLAAIKRGAQLIFQANPGKIYVLNEMKNTQAISLQTSFYVSKKMNLFVYRNP